jgi:hypothetical protein
LEYRARNGCLLEQSTFFSPILSSSLVILWTHNKYREDFRSDSFLNFFKMASRLRHLSCRLTPWQLPNKDRSICHFQPEPLRSTNKMALKTISNGDDGVYPKLLESDRETFCPRYEQIGSSSSVLVGRRWCCSIIVIIDPSCWHPVSLLHQIIATV